MIFQKASGAWNSASTWFGGVVPITTDDVTVSNVVTSWPTNLTLHSLTLSEAAGTDSSVANCNLTVTDLFIGVVLSQYTFNSITCTRNALFSNDTSGYLTGFFLNNNSTFQNLTISGGMTFVPLKNLTVNGLFTLESGGRLGANGGLEATGQTYSFLGGIDVNNCPLNAFISTQPQELALNAQGSALGSLTNSAAASLTGGQINYTIRGQFNVGSDLTFVMSGTLDIKNCSINASANLVLASNAGYVVANANTTATVLTENKSVIIMGAVTDTTGASPITVPITNWTAPPTLAQITAAVAAAILKTPANLLGTDGSGNVAANNLPNDYAQRSMAPTWYTSPTLAQITSAVQSLFPAEYLSTGELANLATIISDLNGILTGEATGTQVASLSTLITGIKATTDKFGFNGNNVNANAQVVGDKVGYSGAATNMIADPGANVAAIRAKTDNLPAVPAAKSDVLLIVNKDDL